MKHRLLLAAPLALGVMLLIATPRARADLAGVVQDVLADRLLHKASVGIEIIRLGGAPGEAAEVFSREASQPLVPASNLKVVTTSAALDRLGPNFRFRTLLVRAGEDIVLVGDGDPTFGDAEYLKRVGWKPTTVYENWAAQLQKVGVTGTRDVIVDDSVFDEDFFNPRWPPKQWDARFEAQVGGMNFNANLVDMLVTGGNPGERASVTLDPPTRYLNLSNTCITGGKGATIVSREQGTNNVAVKGGIARGAIKASATIHDPSMYAGAVLAETLAANGVRVSGGVRRDRTFRARLLSPAGKGALSVAAVHETPIGTVLARANKESVNLYAESLCKRLGYEAAKSKAAAAANPATGENVAGSWVNGTAAVGEFLKRVGVPETEFTLDDGSGLSRQNVISPRALCRVLAADYYGRNRALFIDTLSVAGIDGTLEDRFHASDLRQRIFGKSGFIEGVSTLTGLLHAKDDNWYVFSIMMNGIPRGSNGEIKLLQERIVAAADADAAARK